ncbi:class I SAM-dependent methyltransferase [Paenibacillus sp. CH40]|uniref:class I SAM-dependent methyltransferase n=1 Tax=Paenibacillus sp. CH40 TaxID=2962045 RepID=UPI0020B88B49|nr:class I SAM-dependent methyltransferase [Paenibacillus sp. CH40]MCP3795118.1 class I SAM-dependent methyltransferase [Paenibacillus sp. CH40]
MQTVDYKQVPGHWILASLGKRVLRPGGLKTTRWMIEGLDVTGQDEVIEFAPGLGITAQITLRLNPRRYIAIEQNEKAASIVKTYASGANREVIIADAEQVPLPDASATVVYGEAMLTMHTRAKKAQIISEARRLLKAGGKYAIHEMCLASNHIEPALRKQIYKDLAVAMRVNATPLTVSEWEQLLKEEGFKVVKIYTVPMHLLHLPRIIQDEGWLRFGKISFNLMRNHAARTRVMGMRKQFVKYADHLQAVSIIAER